MVRDIKRPADVVSKLVVMNGGGDFGEERVGIALPGISVEDGISRVLVDGAVEVLASRFGDDANLPAGGPAVFGTVIGGQDLNFLGGIHVGGPEAGSIRPSTNGRSAVKRNQTFRRACAVDVRGSLAEAET